MDRADLRSFLGRSRALVEAAPPTSAAETRAWLVEPLLETLGWDVHADTRRPDDPVAGVRLEYLLVVESTPSVFVAVESFAHALDAERARRLQTAIDRTGVDGAIYTNGRHWLVFVGSDGDPLECRLPSLLECDDALASLSKASVRRRLERHSRRLVARRLAVDRATLANSIAADLASVAGDAYSDEFRTAAGRFVDELVESLVDDSPRATSTDGETDGSTFEFDHQSVTDRPADENDRRELASRSDDSRSESPTETKREIESAASTTSSTADASRSRRPRDSTSDESAGADDGPDTDENGEYVVRFFNDRGSIGAVGHSSPGSAMAHAAEYLLERGLSGVRVPWQSDDGVVVLNDEPVRADGTPMPSSRELSNGWYLDTSGTRDEQATRVVAMAERAGLRAMLTGDWSATTD